MMLKAFTIGAFLFLVAIATVSAADYGSFTEEAIVAENAKFSTMALDGSNIVHIAYVNSTDLGYCNNTAGTWTCTSLISGYYEASPSIAIDNNSKVHVAVFNGTNWSFAPITYCNNTLGSWSCENISVADTVYKRGVATSIAIDKYNKVHIAYTSSKYSKMSPPPASCLFYCNNSEGWACQSAISCDYATYISTAIDSNNTVHIAFQAGWWLEGGETKLWYCYNSSSWTCTRIAHAPQFSSEYGILGPGLAVLPDGYKWVTYSNDTKIWACQSPDWDCSQVDDIASDSKVQIDYDANGAAYIAFFANNQLRYCNDVQNLWDCQYLTTVSYYPDYLGYWDDPVTVFGLAATSRKGRLVDANYTGFVAFSFNKTTGLTYGQILNLGPVISSVEGPSGCQENNSIVSVTYTQADRDGISNSSCWFVSPANQNYTFNSAGNSTGNCSMLLNATGTWTINIVSRDIYSNPSRYVYQYNIRTAGGCSSGSSSGSADSFTSGEQPLLLPIIQLINITQVPAAKIQEAILVPRLPGPSFLAFFRSIFGVVLLILTALFVRKL